MNKQATTTDALLSLRPGAAWSMLSEDYDQLQWLDDTQVMPTRDEIAAEIARLQADYDSKSYRTDRYRAYPSINDQLDMLWHALDQGKLDKTSDFYTTLATVKAQYPKGDTQ